ncbi:MAG: Micrococcal nuclease-like protein nuclease [Candidatus Daviesbacteria bacterium GW2011_GWB1_39_5]|uniref:Micrococcal nuclease-like protein nuclease n=1 Tax=Candidatus Daviesbacteria bacterium GW2011_GWC2_40_12 TaxID=1618431 RepID=A0A0G0TWL9_9BACT|nr:MAG: Micrococcal nuclease-like protein nuclease [Candidatus Daviesbacteria bacterium GW2011_GWF2_38_7]KKR16852.1 MAG: Micrococcal nuclease-like protein nuclease [Candidatus Daviesbacteria bacterium GW2011_GWA2_39_33]KKR22770.1 MAG: Micrococcal nuclease-like protein nuclease [Candidatus Daviesbacteria bacterium GW2011_GWB1_39_5]KKR42367.1 MAG: Micrococcal nuclease-like protein nuclease [Candidatus Daviesbacteria bacterium GW2011_GWC2_40_12]OGE22283.1 MAG: hypothetical protein A2778_00335 [Can
MGQNTKLLIIVSLLILFTGFAFVWFGFRQPESAPTPITETVQPEASSSARPLEAEQATFGIEGERVLVKKVVDGDTIELADNRTVRFIGIDTPETVDPRRAVGCFGKEASNEVKNLLSGKEIILQKDVSETDKYKRILRYVYLPINAGEMLFVNDYLVREGFAKVLTYPPDVKFNDAFRQAEREAKENKRGLWGRCGV